ncbi:solute carrier family 25 member 47-A isoform X2 [Corythoichthys intestinalis]|uniref:solute carrier family 25 member 47-A isoform X2 n=1 Tax=Corythoichthys intestinalis TaxID=161448 RepID=UPI0025A66523|nr:solute carrier family 25 member 47-A isoform X2 [Corythoichthys intestinalis]XP_057678951.1 solute carrier family 25 member 47-A isoform X2 [Corythoichthys intestinalis]XP_057678952.1 solute carrier family 25 member 47-A isoform X2 [Corythoichthys intestinalis]XP_057678953.1 solute carrier family 25 member 47-A isoform X2 [Corythoichthys intestinalis]XP_057678954.1 solute carrier family 25 member 47-A isoform X2 [Corythoichthys intestinalis]XP_057678955.1 solute carrier family 25 member 47-
MWACGLAVGYPLDTVKVRIQTQRQFTGVWQCIASTFSKEGVHGFFKGMSLPMATMSVTSSVAFGTYRNCLYCLKQARGAPYGPSTKPEIFLSGMVGGIMQMLFIAPGDIIKVRLQCQTESVRRGSKPKYRGPAHCLLSILKEEGLRGLYRGALPLALRDGPGFAIYFLSYNTICEMLTGNGKDKPAWSAVMLAGGFAGTLAWSFSTPMDVIKARMQMDGVRGTRHYSGLVHCITETARTEGVAVFYRSMGINCLRAFPVNVVVFVTYELLTGLLQATPDHTDPPRVGLE